MCLDIDKNCNVVPVVMMNFTAVFTANRHEAFSTFLQITGLRVIA